MGYYTKVKGEIRFYPPISAGYAKMNPPLSKYLENSGAYPDIELAASGVYGLLDTIHCPTPHAFKAYELHDNLVEIVTCLPTRGFRGRLELHGEDGDIFGYRIKAGKVEQIGPELVWPED